MAFAGNLRNLSIQDHHSIMCHRSLNLEKLTERNSVKLNCHQDTKSLHVKLTMRKGLTITILTGK